MSNSSPSARPTSGTVTTSSFPAFSRLPKELRIMIWKEALPGPRIVFLRYQRLSSFRCRRVWSNCATDPAGTKQFFGRDEYSSMADHTGSRRQRLTDLPTPIFGFRPQAASIPLLYVCQESWSVASSVYTRAFGTAAAFPDTWFDFNRDVLYTDFDHPLEALSLDVKRVKNLATCARPVTYNRVPRRIVDERILADVLEYFGQVRSLWLVNSQHISLDRGELITTDFPDIGRSSLYFKGLHGPYDRASDKRMSSTRVHSAVHRDWETQRHFPFHIEKLERYRSASPEHPRFKMPIIDRKTITALETKLAYDKWIADYNSTKDRYRTRLYLRCQGHEDLKLNAEEMMNMEEVMNKFFHIRNISSQTEHAKILVRGEELDRSSTVYDLDLKSGVKLDIVLCS